MTSSPDKNGWIGKKKDDWTDEDFLLKQGWKPESIAIVKYWIDRSGGWGVLKQQPELETLKTKARFWDDYVKMSKHSTWVEDEAYATMKEKARKWDDFVDGKNINDVSVWREKAEKWDEAMNAGCTATEMVSKWQEKAEKYDNMVARGSWFDPDEMDMMKEKAKLWDDHLAVNAAKGVYPNPLIQEWKVKAKNWDRLLVGTFHIHESTDSKVVFDWINEWQEKARKWDEHKCPVTLESLYKERLDKINEIVNESITE